MALDFECLAPRRMGLGPNAETRAPKMKNKSTEIGKKVFLDLN